ncbi:MAG: hypothetical protein MMC23_007864 [Stictis urceolatum]|nr:hypothetical protein [Stictis urceolata]
MDRFTVAILGCFVSMGVCQAPIEMQWNTRKSYGPDGPWQAVSVSVGTNNQKIDLYPGGWFETDILGTSMCPQRSNCSASEAGVFDFASSKPAVRPGQFEKSGFIDQWDAGPETNMTGSAEFMIDELSLNTTSDSIDIPNTIFSVIESSNIKLPNGTSYPTQVGYLALGGPGNASMPKALVNGSEASGNILTSYLHDINKIPSNTWGLHIGSVQQGQGGSLILGGYAKDRALGSVGGYTLGGIGGGEPIVSLVGVTLDVESGGTPFNTSHVSDLFQPRKTGNVSVPVSLNPTVPYMQLPIGQCEAIAEFLPVTLNTDLGLYTWNTNDPMYSAIVKSPAFIAFSFQMNATDDLTIKVPFSLLDLTLEPPLLSTARSYFPCKPYNSPDGRYFLGRAFLQAAYLATHWGHNKFFLAQAPGPKGSAISTIIPFQPEDTQMQSTTIDAFASSWKEKWVEIDPSCNGTSVSCSPDSQATSSSPKGLSTIQKIAICIGAVSAVAIALIVALIVYRRQKKRRRLSSYRSLPFSLGNMPAWSREYYEEKPLPPIRDEILVVHEMEAPVGKSGPMQKTDSIVVRLEADSRQVRQEADSREVGVIPLVRFREVMYTK